MSRISVVVHASAAPAHLRDCLTSVMRQSHENLDVVVVPDGTPETQAVAADFAGRDKRFRLLTQAAATAGAARDLGTAAASGEYLAFVHGRDVLPPGAYVKLLASLEETGSDFATGNVRVLDGSRSAPLPGLGDVFRTARRRIHVSRFPALLSDDAVTNKLFRRESWQGFVRRLPAGASPDDLDSHPSSEGHELFRDPEVSLPAHVLARAVDVVPEPVYLARPHDGPDALYGQVPTRAALRQLRAMLTLGRFLAEHAGSETVQRYHQRVLSGDLARIVRSIDRSPEADQAQIVAAVADYLDVVPPRLLHRLPAPDRLTYHLLARRLVPEVVDVLEGRRLGIRGTPLVRRRGRFHAAYPFFEDPAVGVPRHVYRLGRADLEPVVHLDRLTADEGRLTVEGYAYLHGVGAPSPHLPRMVALLRPQGGTRRSRIARTLPLRVERVRRQDVTADVNHPQESLDWSGFRVTINARRLARRAAALARRGGLTPGSEPSWRLEIVLQAGSVVRAGAPRPPRGSAPMSVPIRVAEGRRLQARLLPTGGLAVRAERMAAELRTHNVGDGHLRVRGRLHRQTGDTPRLRARRRPNGTVHEVPVTFGSPTDFEAAIPLDVLAAGSGDATWHLFLATPDDKAVRVSSGEDMPESTYRVPHGDRPDARTELVVDRTRDGNVRVRVRTPQAAITQAMWTGHRLHLSGTLPGRSSGGENGHVAAPQERSLVARNRATGEEHCWPVSCEGDGFTATISPFGVTSLAGTLPLEAGRWVLGLARAGGRRGGKLTPLEISAAARASLADPAEHRHKQVALSTSRGRAVLTVSNDLGLDERGSFQQRRLAELWYPIVRTKPLRDAVLYVSFHGQQYSDSPRMIHEELVRRGADLEHLWVVRDGQVQLPPSAVPVRQDSTEHYEALARARYVVVNDHLRPSFRRRDDQVVLQTWHGTPLKALGFDLTQTRPVTRRYLDGLYRQTRNWQYVLSPNPHSTQMLRGAYRLDGTILEVGYPRNDVFFRPDREQVAANVRARLNVPDGKRVVLYAPTFRDHVTDGGRRFRLDLHLDLDLLRRVLGDDHVLLVRTHRYVVDPVPGDGDGFVTDVSRYPDVADLMLAADVLVTDYSSIMFDFANTGRPMVFYTYDLERYRDDARGLYVDFETEAPGPLLRTSADVAAALRDVGAVSADYDERYRGFAERFCSTDDGHASARTVDRVFADVPAVQADAGIPSKLS